MATSQRTRELKSLYESLLKQRGDWREGDFHPLNQQIILVSHQLRDSMKQDKGTLFQAGTTQAEINKAVILKDTPIDQFTPEQKRVSGITEGVTEFKKQLARVNAQTGTSQMPIETGTGWGGSVPVGILSGAGLTTIKEIATDTVAKAVVEKAVIGGSMNPTVLKILAGMGAFGAVDTGVEYVEKATGFNIPGLGYSSAELKGFKKKKKRRNGIYISRKMLDSVNKLQRKMKQLDRYANKVGYDIKKKVRTKKVIAPRPDIITQKVR